MFTQRHVLAPAAVCLLVVSWWFPGKSRAADNWPQFRGPAASGVSGNSGLPDTWSAVDHVAWKTPIPGRGWSSPIVWGERIFLTTAIREEGEPEAVKKGLYFGGNRPAPKDVHRWMVYCLDLDSGKILWEKEVHQGIPQHGHHLKNSLASETPVCDGERVYAYIGNVGLFCSDLDGELLWSKRWDSVPTRFGWGTAASPVLHGERIYVVNDNDQESFLVALDKRTGDQIWRVERDEKSNWATPFVWENEKRTELITPGTGKIRSYGLDGQLLWELGGMSTITVPTPFAKHGLLYVTSGYVMDRRKPLFAIRPGASGDISLEAEQAGNEYIAWCQKQAGPYNPSPIVYGDYLYVLYDRGLLACYNAKTGEEVYGKRRIGPGAKAFTSSPWAYDGKIFCLSEDGDTFVIQAGLEFKLLAKNSLGELCMATPAIVRDGLIIRTESHLLRVVDATEEPLYFDVNDGAATTSDSPTIEPWRTIRLEPDYGGLWVVAGDLDGDGTAEIVAAENFNEGDVHYTSAVVAQRLSGKVLWAWGAPDVGRKKWHHDVACEIYDWDGDGRQEVVVCDRDFLVELDGPTGKEKRRFAIPEEATDCLVFCNLEGDAHPSEVLVKDRYHRIYAYDHAGRLLWQVTDPGGYRTAHQPRPIDLDGDGRDEIIAGFAVLNADGSHRWTLASEKVDLHRGHLDCARVLQQGNDPAEFRIALTCCGANNVAVVDGNGKLCWERCGHHFESLQVGRLHPEHPAPHILVDIDHSPQGESPLWILDAKGRQLGQLITPYGRHHRLVDWTGDGTAEFVVAGSQGIYDHRGKRIGHFAMPASLPLGKRSYETSALVGDMTGDGVPDILFVTPDHVYIYENEAGRKPDGPASLGTGVNFTLY